MVTSVHAAIDRALRGVHPRGAPISQDALATRFGCSQGVISDYLLGRSVPPRTRVGVISRGLELDEAEFAAACDHDRRELAKGRLVKQAAAYLAERRAGAA